MKKRAWLESESIRYAVVSQLVFLAALAICAAIRPHLLIENNPISMFGNLRATAIPFVLGFFVTAGILFRAATLMPMVTHEDRYLRRIFIVLGIVMIGLPVTPFTVNAYFYYAHVTFAAIFYITALWSGAWFCKKRNWQDIFLYIIMATGIIGAIFSTSEVGTLHLLAASQLTTIMTFSVMLIRFLLHKEAANERTQLHV